MAIKFRFDSERFVETPTIILSTRNGKKLGAIPAENIHYEENMNSSNDISFKVNKESNGRIIDLWDEIKDFKLIWCKEWDAWFEITVEINQSDGLSKSINGKSLGEAELSCIYLYEMEVNTEDDIDTSDYVHTILYNPENKRGSLIDRILEKAPHYTIKHVDSTIKDIQRTFSFDGTSIYDAFQEIAEEIECLFIISQTSNELTGLPERGIYVYDLLDFCNNCGNRGDFQSVCDECGSSNITRGYGNDTTIFITNENLASEITFTTDTDQVKNCFRMVAGDDLMTASVISINPNGTQYLWYVSDEQKSDMSDELRLKLYQYDQRYNMYNSTYSITYNSSVLNSYNTVINKYKTYNSDLGNIANSVGYPSLITALYNTIDAESYLTDALMPTIEIDGYTASQQAALLISSTLSPLAVSNLSTASQSTVELNLLSMAKAIVNQSFTVKIKSSSYNTSTHVWSGKLTVENYSDEEDVADTGNLTLTVTGDYDKYVKQKIDKILRGKSTESYDTYDIFQKALSISGSTYSGAFMNEMHKYALNPLKTFHSVCQSCLDILVEEGISDSTTWLNSSSDLYTQFYTFYRNRLNAIQSEIKVRENEITAIKNMYNAVISIRKTIQKALDFKNFLGDDRWKEFCAYRKESDYKNDNYISDGLTNAEILNNAKEFMKIAKQELKKSATFQHSISSSLYNLLVIHEFNPLINSFELGNYLRIKLDERIYKLRLINYSVDFDNLEEINVEFSDVTDASNDVSDIQSILKQSTSIASTYNSVERQSDANTKTSKTVSTWFEDGLDITLTKLVNTSYGQTMTWDEHGMLMRKYDEPSDTYSNEQLKIINSTIAITTDNWATTKTAIGRFYYINPANGHIETAYGVNGETIVGKMILGSTLALYNSSGSLKFNNDGLLITNSTNSFIVNPNSVDLFKILKGNTAILTVNSNGNLSITGAITATSLSLGTGVTIPYGSISSTPDLTVYIAKDGTVGTTPADGVNGFKVSSAGVLTASNAVIYGSIYASGGKIGNWVINSTYLGYGTIATSGSAFLIPAGISSSHNIGGSGSISGWTITSGANFGVTNTGAMYCSSGKVGGWVINTSSIYTGTYGTGTSSGDVTLSSVDFSRNIGGISRSNLRFAIGSNFAVQNNGTVYVNNIVAHREYSIFGSRNANGSDGDTYGILRGDTYTINDSRWRTIGIGAIFESDDYSTSNYNMPRIGIIMNTYGTNRSNTGNKVLIKMNPIQGVVIDANLTCEGLASFDNMYVTSINGATPCIVESINKDETIQLTNGCLYLLITFHNSSDGSRSAYVLKGGATAYITLKEGSNITLNITKYNVSFSCSANNPNGRLIKLV